MEHSKAITLLQQPMQQRLTQLISDSHAMPERGSRPLTIAGRVCGWVHPKAMDVLTQFPYVRCDGEPVHLAALIPPSEKLDSLLAELAVLLNEAGCVKAWRDEALDVYGEGENFASIERGAVRALGLLTHAVHLNAWRPDGRLWVQKRAAHKATDPNMWDTLVGGLASTGESLESSLRRECEEEAGLYAHDLQQLEPMRFVTRMHRRLPEGYQVENVWVNDCVLPESCQPVNQDGEVSEIAHFSVEEYWEMSQAGLFTIEADIVILDSILKRLPSHGATAST